MFITPNWLQFHYNIVIFLCQEFLFSISVLKHFSYLSDKPLKKEQISFIDFSKEYDLHHAFERGKLINLNNYGDDSHTPVPTLKILLQHQIYFVSQNTLPQYEKTVILANAINYYINNNRNSCLCRENSYN